MLLENSYPSCCQSSTTVRWKKLFINEETESHISPNTICWRFELLEVCWLTSWESEGYWFRRALVMTDLSWTQLIASLVRARSAALAACLTGKWPPTFGKVGDDPDDVDVFEEKVVSFCAVRQKRQIEGVDVAGYCPRNWN